jgi:hypothetical protein
MAELEWDTHPKRPSLRRAVRHRVRDFERPLRIAAENFLAAESRMDLLGVGLEGELVSLRIGVDEDDAQLLTRSLSDLSWLRARSEDLAKLVPDLGIEPSAEARALLLCTDFQDETRRAIECVSFGSIELITYRCYRHRGQLGVLLDHSSTARHKVFGEDRLDPEATEPVGGTHSAADPPDRPPLCTPETASGFRTGLTDAELRPDADELIDMD